MLTQKKCPMCGTLHNVEITHEFKVLEGRKVFELVLRSQAANLDDSKLDWLCPEAPDGQRLETTTQRIDAVSILMSVTRKPENGRMMPAEPSAKRPRNRAELLTHMAEVNLDIDKKLLAKMTDEQLSLAIDRHVEGQVEDSLKRQREAAAKAASAIAPKV